MADKPDTRQRIQAEDAPAADGTQPEEPEANEAGQPTVEQVRAEVQAILDAAGYTFAVYAIAPKTAALVPAREFTPDGWPVMVDYVKLQKESANGKPGNPTRHRAE